VPLNYDIFGVNFADYSQGVSWTVNRLGGNGETDYNYLDDSSNSGNDWFYITSSHSPAGTSLPSQNTQNIAAAATLTRNAKPMVTAPLTGWVAKGGGKFWSYDTAVFGPQQCVENNWQPGTSQTAGNGRTPQTGCVAGAPSGPYITNVNAGSYAHIPITGTWITNWVTQLRSRHGAGKVVYFSLDNEPHLWSDTHHDIVPANTNASFLWSRTVAVAPLIKSAEPLAKTFGPVTWGWCDLYWTQADNCGQSSTDRNANGGLPFLRWYIQQVGAYYLANNVKLVDYIDLHWYPQGTGITLSSDESASVQAARLRSIKELWDTSYISESWLKDVSPTSGIALIPMVKNWISNSSAPWLKLAITEYNWGYGYSGALAHSEILSIFARYGLDLATQWAFTNANRQPDAFNLYLNYNGAGAKVSGDSVPATSDNYDTVGAYALDDATLNKLFIFLFNKATTAVPVSGSASGAISQSAPHYSFSASSALHLDTAVTISASGGFSISLPARTAHLIVATTSATATSAPTTSAPTTVPPTTTPPPTGTAVYTDVLNWQDWSWNCTRNWASTGAYAGTKCGSIGIGNNFGALYLHAPAAFNWGIANKLKFAILPISSLSLNVALLDSPNAAKIGQGYTLTSAVSSSYTVFTLNITQLTQSTTPRTVSGFWIQAGTTSLNSFRIDEIWIL